ncbi:hypothetical protein MMC17_007877 [Xylographa soralifera]|nr:hypothetical protein [Xylographa soralifera]
MRSLLEGLRNEDGVCDLQRRLDLIPADLEEYFSHMMGTLDPFYLEQAGQLFRVPMHARDSLSLMAYSFVHEQNPNYAIQAPIRPLSSAEMEERSTSTKRRLNSRCKGLLEAHYNPEEYMVYRGTVNFLHRTVEEFLKTREAETVLHTTFNSADKKAVNHILCCSFLAQLKCLAFEPTLFLRLVWHCLLYALEIERDSGTTPTALIDELDRAASTISPIKEWFNNVAPKKGEFDSWLVQPEWKNTYLILTLRAGLRLYVKEKLEGPILFVQEKQGRPILDYLLRPNFKGKIWPDMSSFDIEIISLVLKRGANPNQAFDKFTVWGHFLLSLHHLKTTLENLNLYHITELLVNHGAHKSLDIDTGRYVKRLGMAHVHKYKVYLSPLDILDAKFGAEGARRFNTLFTQHAKSSRKRNLLDKILNIFS